MKTLSLETNKFYQAGQKLTKVGEKIQGVGSKISSLGDKLTRVGTTAGIAVGGLAVKSAMEFETAFTGVEKTVDGTEEQMKNLKQGIKDLSKELPSTTTEIAAVAEAAGQLGIETDNILGFSKAMIDLGNSTNLTSEEAAQQLAKFANITKMSQKNFDKLGSSIVDLGNNFATTEADIVNMAMRLAGAGNQVGMSEGQILGLATALSSVGIEAEMGGSAISKAMVKMQNAVELGGGKLQIVLDKTGMSLRDLELMAANNSKDFKALAGDLGLTSTELKNMINAGANLRDFSKVAGMSAKEFKKAWKEDATKALYKFIQGLGNTEDKGESAITMLSEMGLTEVRLRDSLLRAANASKLFNDAIDTGTKAFNENTALTKEANKRYATLESRLKTTKNKVNDMVTNLGDKLTPTINRLLDKVDGFAKRMSNLSEEEAQNIIRMGMMVVAAGPLLKIIGALTSGIGTTIKAIGTFSNAIAVMKTGVTTGQASIDGLAKVLTGLTSPAGIATIAITAAVAAIALIGIAAKNAEKKTKESFENMGKSASDYISNISMADSHLDEFNRTLFVSAKEQKNLEEEMKKVQKGITLICKTASDERREYTQAEIKQLDEYFRKLRELNQRELEIEQSIAKSISQQAISNAETFQGTLGEYKVQSQEWIKTAEEQKEKEIKLINTQTTEEIALLNQRYGTKATMENEAYKKEYDKITANKDAKIKEANDEVAKISSIYTKGYAQRASQDGDFYEHIQHYYWEQENEEKRHNSALESIQNNGLLTSQNKIAARISAEERHEKEQTKIWKKMYKNMSDSESEQLGAWLGMVAQTELYGGKIDDETSKLVDNIIKSYDKMPKGTRQAMKDAMQPMLEEMEKKEPTLYSKATNIANGILSRLRVAFNEHSPSKETREIFKYVMQGAELGLEDERKNLYSKIDSLANGVLEKFKDALEISSPSKKMKDEVGKNIALGVIQGVDSQKKNVKKSAEKLANLYVSAAKQKLSVMKEKNKITEAQEIDFWNTIVQHTKKGTKAYTTAINALNTAKNKLKKDIKNLTKQYINDVAEANKELEKNINDLKNNYKETVNNRKKEIVNSLNLFDDVNLTEKIDKKTLKNNLKNQVNALKEWDKTLDSLRKRLGDGDLLKELEGQGVNSLNILKELNSMSDSELKEYNNLYNQKNKIALSRAKTENEDLKEETDRQIEQLRTNTSKKINSLTTTYEKELKALGVTTKKQSKKIGTEISAGISDGMTEGMKSLSKKMKSEIKSLIKGVKKDLKIKSPSKVFKDEIGKFMALGIGAGFEENISDAYKQISSQLRTETDKLSKILENFNIGDLGDIQGNITSHVIENTKTVFTTPNINFYPQEMTEDNLKACLNYINRKFGSAY